MMRVPRWTAVLSLALLVVGCDGATRVQGHVRDSAGKPLKDAAVTLSYKEWRTSVKSQADGSYSVSRTHAPFRGTRLLLTADLYGYKRFEQELRSAEYLRTVDITLIPTPQPSHANDTAAQKSCREFAQMFYDWYTPIANRDNLHGPAFPIALRERKEWFSPQLHRLLSDDVEAQAKVEGEIVGIDADPFLTS